MRHAGARSNRARRTGRLDGDCQLCPWGAADGHINGYLGDGRLAARGGLSVRLAASTIYRQRIRDLMMEQLIWTNALENLNRGGSIDLRIFEDLEAFRIELDAQPG